MDSKHMNFMMRFFLICLGFMTWFNWTLVSVSELNLKYKQQEIEKNRVNIESKLRIEENN
jgi:hypothetical protein